MRTNVNETTERRLDGNLRFLRLAAVLCALFAAVGIGHGIYAANPDGGYFIPVFAGFAAATALAVFWHVLIGAITGMVRLPMMVSLFAVGFLVTAVAIGASAQSIATAISGHAAMSAELAVNVDTYNQKLADAYGEATGWSAVANAALATGTGLELQAEREADGDNGKGAGKGPRYASLMNSAQSFLAGAAQLDEKLTGAAQTRDSGNTALATMRDAAAHADTNAFMRGAEGVVQAIADLNAVDPMPIVNTTGAVVASEKGIDLTVETQKFYDTAATAMADREQVQAPTFVPFSMGEATRRQMLGAAMHGWILAAAIDILPFVFLIVAFLMSREVWHNEQVQRRKLTPQGKDDRDRDVLHSMRGEGKSGNDNDRDESPRIAAE